MAKRMNFRQKLMTAVILVPVLCIGAMGVVSYMIAQEQVQIQEGRRLTDIARNSMSKLSIWMADRERDAILFSENGVFKAATIGQRLDEAQERLRIYQGHSPYYENIFVMAPSGRILMDATGDLSDGEGLSGKPILEKIMDKARQGGTWVSDVQKDTGSGEPVFLITAPISANGNLTGVMGAAVNLKSFSDYFLGKENTTYTYIVDADGRIISHPDPGTIFNTDISDQTFGRTLIGNDSGEVAYDWEGLRRIGRFVTYQPKNWTVVTAVRESELMAPLKKMRLLFLALGGVMILLLSTIIWLISRSMLKVISRAVYDMEMMSDQVASAAHQISGSSGQLAEGASEQAASLEETSSSLEQMASMTHSNASNANEAKGLVNSARKSMDQADATMSRLNVSMEEISKASKETQKIVKTIDEISFQTNLLALNAAVEAARAGEAGAGFAVVADEVRNLAMRAAEAARNTAALIEGTVKKIKANVGLVEEANDRFTAAAEGTARIESLVEEIAAASSEQASGIEQVNRAVSEMDKVTQQNAANAQESASAAEQMNAQAELMKTIVAKLVSLLGRSAAAGLAGDIGDADRQWESDPWEDGAGSRGQRGTGRPARGGWDADRADDGPEYGLEQGAGHGMSSDDQGLRTREIPDRQARSDGKKAMTPYRAREVSPSELIPLDEDDFKEF